MPANTVPIFSRLGDVASDAAAAQSAALTTNESASSGFANGISGTLVFTADATNGGYVKKLRLKARSYADGVNLANNVASVARVYINNGLTPATAANNHLYGEISLPATTGIATAAISEIDYIMDIALPAGFRVYVGLGTTVAAGWVVTPIGGKY